MPSSFIMSLSPCFTGTQGSKLEYHQLDISKPDSVAAFASWLKQQHGKLDILVNNAGALFVDSAGIISSQGHRASAKSSQCCCAAMLTRSVFRQSLFWGLRKVRAGQAHNSVSERLRAAPA